MVWEGQRTFGMRVSRVLAGHRMEKRDSGDHREVANDKVKKMSP